MPRKQDLSQAVIYHIRRMETKEVVYVGSSCNFKQRRKTHKSSCYAETNNAYNYPVYVYIREQGGFNLFEVVPISFHKLDNEIELLILEQNEIDKYPNAYNKLRAYITEEQRVQKKKEWNEANKEEMKKYQEKHKEKLAHYNKEYYEANKEHHAQQMKERYEKNKAEINAKVECPCCKKMTIKQYLSRHQKGKACVLDK